MPWQLPFVKEVKLFTQMFWLNYSLSGSCVQAEPSLRGVEHLRITLQRGDWWFNEQNHPFTINPHHRGFLDEYNEDVEQEEHGVIILWKENGELEMEFKTLVDWQEELKKVVERALRWKFPMGERGVLGNKGLGMEWSKWQSEDEFLLPLSVKNGRSMEVIFPENNWMKIIKSYSILKLQAHVGDGI
ncbi:hypothetical protein B0H14DRAFT_3605682 [Mycena olivaceomarginata]|nr:hypothetical protein B0H14DRAFT_3605682 [Mycena olivaceomarginata]